jgi:hypothetical protein
MYLLKKYIIISDWLRTFVTLEPYFFSLNLKDRYEWTLVWLSQSETVNRIFSEESVVLLITYESLELNNYNISDKCKIIYKIDDQQRLSINTNNLLNRANLIISPYAYLLKQVNKLWIPYSCVDKYIEPIHFNNNPSLKILISGSVTNEYPFRSYLVELNDKENFEYIKHPGYEKKYTETSNNVGYDFHKLLNKYICCFTDASKYKYVLLKHFEIAGSGSLLLADDTIEYQLKELGFINYKTCILCNKDTIHDKVKFIIDPKNRHVIDVIRKNGMELVRSQHLTSHRAKLFDDKITELYNNENSSVQ